MYNILNNSKSGMSANQSKMDIISNNIVNVNSTGYKRLEMDFQELITETLYKDSYPTNSLKSLTGTGVRASNEFRNFEQGPLRNTDIKSNLAIDGEGFFRIIRNDGSYAYTRNGEFNIDSLGKLVDDSGNILEVNFENGYSYDNSNLTKESLSINNQGEVFSNNIKVGNINLYTSTGENDFISVGGSLYSPKDITNIRKSNNTNILQGYIEISNVNMQKEMTDMIIIQRAFQFNSKGIQAADDMWSMVNNLQSR